MVNITILGNPISQKNSKQIVTNKYTGRTMLISNQKVRDWKQTTALQLNRYKVKFDKRVQIDFMFYVKDNRRRDLENMISGCQDSLVDAGILKDDSWQWLRINSADAKIDRENPRSEMIITEIEKD